MKFLVSVLSVLFLANCSTANRAGETTDDSSLQAAPLTSVPYYRFFRGWKKPEISQPEFLKLLNERFVPAAAATHAKNGLVAYAPALLPAERMQRGLPDEVALVAYESKDVYDAAKATPEGQVYADMHFEVFTKDSKSLVPAPLAADLKSLAAEQAYDIINLPIDWQSGVTGFYFGIRKQGVSKTEFLKSLANHVRLVQSKMQPRGLDGYLVIATEDYEIAYMHWSSRARMDAANASADGPSIAADAGKIMDTQMWQTAAMKEFNGGMKLGELINYKFKRR